MNRIIRKSISIVLSLVLISLSMMGCAKKSENIALNNETSQEQAISTEDIAEIISENIQAEAELQAEPITISEDWEDYAGDIDTIVYGLISNEYQSAYEVFDASVILSDDTEIFGIGYTDFAEYFESDDESGFFSAGFIPLIGEPVVPTSEIEAGLEIIDLQNSTNYSFVYAYEIESYTEHCVIWDQYLQYGINDEGCITYSVQSYNKEICDESLGALYSYDADRYLYDPEVGDYTYISGLSLSQDIDYSEFEKEINRILEEQDYNFSKSDVETAAYFAQEAVESYLLSMQEETFMGYSVAELVELTKTLDPLECIRVTPDGTIVINVENDIPESPDKLTKWLVGITCGIVVVVSVALDIFVPVLTPLSGVMSGAAIEVFMQVVVENQTLENVNWKKVAVSSASGAMLAWACPALAASATKGVVNIMGEKVTTAALSKLAGYATLTFTNAMVTGTTSVAFALMDGATSDDAFDVFWFGAAIGGAGTIFASAFAEAGNAAMKALEKTHPNNWLTKATNKAGTFIGKHQVHIKNQSIENILAPKSVYEASKCAINELQREMAPAKILMDEIKQLPSDRNKNLVKFDTKGNILTKNQVLENGGNCIIRPSSDCDPKIMEAFKQCNINEIVVKNGVPDFSTISTHHFIPIEGITSNRDINMRNYYDQLAEEWTANNFAKMPDVIKEVLSVDEMENLTGLTVQKALSKANLTPHEGVDGIVYLVDRVVHNKVGHYGGVALAKSKESLEIGTIYFKNLTKSTPPAITGTLIAEEAY